MADFLKMFEQLRSMQSGLQAAQEELGRLTFTASAGGGMVTVECDGKMQLKSIRIDPSVVNPADVEMLEDLIIVAAADAQKKAAEAAQRELGKVTGGLDLPFRIPGL